MKNVFLVTIFSLFLSGTTTKKNSKIDSKPNIIIILADDMGWADSELYGSTYYETPNLTRLAKEGLHFTNAYAASPLCSPTRASIMSGQYPSRLHLTQAITPKDVAEPKALNPKPNQHCGDVQNKNYMPLEIFSLAEALKETGYKTAHIGKWHLTSSVNGWAEGDDTYNADNQGFDFVIGGNHLPGPPDYYSPYQNKIRNLKPGSEGEYLNERLAEESIKWIQSVKDSGSPFYLNFWQYAVHGPWIAKKDLLPKYNDKIDPQGLQDSAAMGTMIESLDHSVGMLLNWLDLPENKSVKENTIILFLSDNGGVVHAVNVERSKKYVTSNRPLRGGKANTYEGGTRIPWIVRWPGHIKEQMVSNTPISTIDIYPTILEIIGAKPKAGHVLDGQSILPLFKGKEIIKDRPLFWDFPHNFGALCASSTTVRQGDLKLLRYYWAGENAKSHYYELFNLSKDPYEAINLASFMPDKVVELDKLISNHLEETNTLVPIQNKNYSGNPRKQRSDPTKSVVRPISYELPHKVFETKSNKGSHLFQLRNQNGELCQSAGLVLKGNNWIQVKNLSNGQVEVSWDKKLKMGDAKVLFGWRGGTTEHEMNDWTLDPYELVIQ